MTATRKDGKRSGKAMKDLKPGKKSSQSIKGGVANPMKAVKQAATNVKRAIQETRLN